jgi:hypothetical protein
MWFLLDSSHADLEIQEINPSRRKWRETRKQRKFRTFFLIIFFYLTWNIFSFIRARKRWRTSRIKLNYFQQKQEQTQIFLQNQAKLFSTTSRTNSNLPPKEYAEHPCLFFYDKHHWLDFFHFSFKKIIIKHYFNELALKKLN